MRCMAPRKEGRLLRELDPRNDQARGAATAPVPPAVADYLRHLEVERRAAAHTLAAYTRDLRKLSAFAAATRRHIDALTRPELEEFVRCVMTDGLSPTSTARLVAGV